MDDLTSTPPRHLWRHRDFPLLLGGRLVSQLGDQLQFLALPLLVVALTGSSTQAGILLGLQTVVYLVFGLVAGALVDRWDRKTTMIWCEIGRGCLTASIPIAAAFATPGMPQLYAVAVLNGVFSTLFGAANSSALPNIVAKRDLPGALGTIGAMSNALRIAGASVAGVAYTAGRMVPFAFNAVSFLASAVFLRAIRADFQRERASTPASPRVLRGRVTSAIDTLTTGAAALGTMASGALIALLGAPTLAVALAGWLTLLALAATLSGTVRTAGARD